MKIIFIRPLHDFTSIEEMIELASGEESDAQILHFTHVPLLPVIVDDDGMPLGIVNQFLGHVALRSKSVTGDTARTYAEALISWIDFLRRHKLEHEDATEERLALFRNFLANSVDLNGRHRYSRATVNNRIAVTEGLYIWAQKTGVIRTPLGEFLSNRNAQKTRGGWSGLYGRARSGGSLRIGIVQRIPRVLAPEELTQLFLIARSPFKLMFRWGVATGMRRFEVCTLRKSALLKAIQMAAHGVELVPIEITRKGGKTLTVHAPAALIEETHWYCLTERPQEAASLYGDFVFLNQRGIPYARGSISQAFRKCADQIGSPATLHHLRHTFATLVLGILESLKHNSEPINSIKTVQILLGHANVTTTEVYLRALEVSTDDVRNALDFLYGATL